jgi:Rieske Fe-S protein
VLRCPGHGMRFDVTGRAGGTAGLQLRSFPVEHAGSEALITIA